MKTTPFHERPEIRIARRAIAKLTHEEYKAIVYIVKEGLKAKSKANKSRTKLNKTPEQLAKERDEALAQIVKRHNAYFEEQKSLSQERIANESHAATS